MCGRYTSTQDPGDLAAEFEAIDETADDRLEPSYNVAPTDRVYTVRMRSGLSQPAEATAPHRAVTTAKWGLVPSWAKDPSTGSRMLNARVESLTTKPAFRKAVQKRRCLIPADGWYEWARLPDSPGKQAYYMTPRDGSVLAFAGLWEVWGQGEDRLITCTVVTTESTGQLTAVHDRMPMVLPRSLWDTWLDRDRTDVEELLVPTPNELVDAMELRPVGPEVGNVRNNGAQLITRQPETQPQTLF